MNKILIVDDDIASSRTLQLHLNSLEYKVKVAVGVDEGLQMAESFKPDLIVLDIRMPGRSGLEGLPDFKAQNPQVHIIMITAFHDMDSTIEAMQSGADDYIHKPIDIDELDSSICKLLSVTKDSDELLCSTVQDNISRHPSMVGRSRAMKEVFKTIGLVSKSPATVLITGESGTGKELVARAVHRSSATPNGPFIAINCAALVETLLESDMFGHEKGAFTGAVGRQEGKFSLARGGTIFLDEVGELSPAMQAKLLRVLQYKEYTPLGAKQAQQSDARVITATNVDLAQKVQEGGFREDLYYRLQVINIHLPPLRERIEDLMDLIQTLLGRINQELHSNVTHISKDVLHCMESYQWPGNVRELENVLMKGVALSHSDTFTRELLPEQLLCTSDDDAHYFNGKPVTDRSLKDVEKEHISRILEANNWHRGRTCEVLGVSRPRLRRMINEYGLEPPQGVDPEDQEE
jgi:DNA-binding NtrC family response regulator